MVETPEHSQVESTTWPLVGTTCPVGTEYTIRHRVLTNQRDRSYVYAVVSLAAGGPFIDSIHGQRNPHRERGLAGMGNGCFAEFCCCVPLCPCELRYSSSKDISFHRFPGDKVAGRECIFKSRRDMPLL